MKQLNITFLLAMLMSMLGVEAFAYAYDFAVANADGVTIYYLRNGSSLEVTNDGQLGSSPYSGDIIIPESVIINGTTYSVTSIRTNAFTSSKRMTSVVIPNSVKSIGKYNQEIKGKTNVEIIPVIA